MDTKIMHEVEVTTKIQIEEDFLRDVFVTAMESGYPWWRAVSCFGGYLDTVDGKVPWNVVITHEDGNGNEKKKPIYLSGIADAIGKALGAGYIEMGFFGDYDALDADIVMQMYVFDGKVVFG